MNWEPQALKKVSFTRKDGTFKALKISTIADRAWQTLVKFVLSPAQEAFFSPRNFGYRVGRPSQLLQKLLTLNLDKNSFGFQKRVMILEISDSFYACNFNYLLKKIIVPKSIKLGIYRFLKIGFVPSFEQNNEINFVTSFHNLLASAII